MFSGALEYGWRFQKKSQKLLKRGKFQKQQNDLLKVVRLITKEQFKMKGHLVSIE